MTDEGQASQGRGMWEEESWKATRLRTICNTSLRDTHSRSRCWAFCFEYTQAPSAEYVIPSDLLSCRFLLPSPPWGIERTERMGRAITRDASETVGFWAGALTFGALLSSAKHEGWASLQLQKGNSAFFFLPHCSHLAPRHQWKSIRAELQLSVLGVGMAWLTLLLIKSRREQINPTMSDLVNWG